MSLELADHAALPDENEPVADLGQLHPADGPAAWRFLFAATIVEAILWAFLLAFGVFQAFYNQLPQFKNDPNIAVIGTTPTSMFYLGSLFVTPLIQKFPRWQRPMIVLGWATCVAALLAASFARTVPELILTQGVLYGTGFLFLYPPLLSMLNEWFSRNRGLAYGILFAGAGASGAAYPSLLQALLARYGYATTFRALAVGQGLLVAAVLPLIKARLPATRAPDAFRRTDASFFAKPRFYCYALANLLHGFAFFIPALYLPSFASGLGYSPAIGALLLTINNVAQILGQVAFGYLADRIENVLSLVFLSSFTSGLAAVTLWGFASSIAPLAVFALIYGLFAGGLVVLWARFGTDLTEDPRTVYNIMAFEKGIGNIAAAPISAALLTKPIMMGYYGLGKYEPLIIFAGVCMFGASAGIGGWRLKWREHVR